MTRSDIQIPSDSLLNCPTCGLPAEITHRFTLNGAPTPVEHVKLVCVKRHCYTLPVDQLPAEPDGHQAQRSAAVVPSGGTVVPEEAPDASHRRTD